ncbi:Tetratricopeptide repeat-containing protein [Cladophialophora immunda]|nr:Tetratricopeptide repeat-containing protein [Cladophialophora immunda]
MNHLSFQGSSRPAGDGSSSTAPPYPYIGHNPPVAPEETMPAAFDGYIPSLVSPLRGLPPYPPSQALLPSPTSLHHTLSARRVVFHDHASLLQPPASPPNYSFAFSQPLLASESYVLNPPSYPQQSLSQPQHTSLFSANATHDNHAGYIPFPSAVHHLNVARAEHSSQNERQLPGIERALVGEDSDTSVDDHGVPGLPSEPVEDDPASPTRGRKRGRPRLALSDRQPRKRRKKGMGPRGGWSKGMKIGPRPALDPGPEFNDLYSQATIAFIDDQDTEKALDLILQAIAVNPEIYSAHALLSEIYFSRDEDEKAIAALFSGAHTIPTDPEVWIQAANACLHRSKGKRETALQQASYCYARIIHTDREHLEARFQRAAVSRELSNYTKAMRDLEAILERMPRNSSVLRQIAEICIETRDLERAKQVYEDTLSYYRENGFEGEESFTWADILVYVQILALEEPPDLAIVNALKTLKQLSRWLLGREEEAYWDHFTDDDREFDSEDEPRRVLVPEFVVGKYSSDAYGPGLPLELRVRLGILRLKQGRDGLDEALAHFEWLEPEARDEGASVYDYPDLFLEVAQALQEAKEHNQALRFYEALKDTNAYSHTEFWLGIAANAYLCGDKLHAVEYYEEAKAGDEKCVEARTQLSRLYAEFGDKEKAMENAREAVRVADSFLAKTDRRKYERKEQRLAREEAESALKEAFNLPGEVVGGTPVDRIESKLQRRMKKTRRTRKAVSMLSKGAIHGQGETEGGLEDEYEDAQDDQSDEEFQLGRAGRDLPPMMDREIAGQTAQNVARKRKDRQAPRSRVQGKTRTKRMTIEEREAHRTETINRLYSDLVYNTEAVRAGDEIARNTWMDCADSLITDFRSNRPFYSKERNQSLDGLYQEAANAGTRQRWERDQENGQDGVEVDQDFPIPTVESSMPTEYREIPFSNWLDVFLEYSLLLAQSPEVDAQHRCYTIVNAALDCVVWNQDQQALLHIYVTYLACTLALQDERTMSTVVLRWFLRTFQFNSEGYRLFAAMNLLFTRPGAVFRSRATHQYLFKQIVQMDANLPIDYDPEGYGPVPDFMRQSGAENASRNRDNDEEAPVPHEKDVQSQQHQRQNMTKTKEMNVDLLMLYGHVLYAGGGFTSALSYFYRALSLSPENPALLLSISLSYMHETLKKHSENRHMCLLQGWAFFEEYADARRRWMQKRIQGQQTRHDDADMARADLEGLEFLVEREIAFNRARCWHMLGLSDLAVRAYEKILSLSAPSANLSAPDPAISAERGKDMDVSPAEFTMEAAYAIQTMYALSGNPQMAREVTEKYLVV